MSSRAWRQRYRTVGPNGWRRLAVLAGTVTLACPLLVPPGTAAAAPGGTDSDVIVQFAGTPALAETPAPAAVAGTRTPAADRVRAKRTALSEQHRSFMRQAAAAGVHATVRADFGNLYNGIALRVPAGQTARLSRLPGVVAVHPDATVHAAGGTARRIATGTAVAPTASGVPSAGVDDDVTQVGAPAVWATTDPSGRPDTGTGSVIAVVDTGIDYTAADLGGGFGPGHKVVTGYDFVNGDADPMDDNGHGTHVAGIAAGNGGRTGVAPGATLAAYKVLSSSGYGSDSNVIAGIEAAVDVDNPYRADVINLSLSGTGDGTDPVAQACEAAVRAGVVVVAAAGNYGPGESSVGSPGAAPDVLTVGASITGIQIPSISLVAPVSRALRTTRLDLSANPPATPSTMDVVDVGSGQAQNYDGKDVKGKAVLAAYNGFQLGELARNAEDHGAAAIMFATPDYYSSGTGHTGPGLAGQPEFTTSGADSTRLGIVAVVVDGADATEMRDDLAAGSVRIQLGGADATDLIPAFSAHGPVPGSYTIKPDLVAPGVEVRSTVPGGYERMSGTSMAAPHVAGAAALLRQAHPDWSGAQIVTALTGTAHLLPGYDPTIQGSGRLDVAAADRATVLAAAPTEPLGLADLSHPTVNATAAVSLTNPTGQPVDVTFSARPVAGQQIAATVTPTQAHLDPGRSATVTLALHGDRPASATDIGGWLQASVGSQAVLTVPYLLAVRPLQVHAAPDPTVSDSEIYVYAEPALAAAPTVTVTAPDGKTVSYQATVDHPHWWRVTVAGKRPGTYHVSASAPAVLTGATTAASTIAGDAAFEVVPVAHGSAPSDWQPVGPDGDGGPMAVSPTRPGRIYALPSTMGHAGVFRTDDGGTTWQEERVLPVGDGIDMAVAADPRQPDTVYLALNGQANDPTYQGRIVASHDAGRTWAVLPFPDESVRGLTTDSTGQVLVAATFSGAYLSPDRGEHWRALPMPSTFVFSARMIGPDLYAATSDGLFLIRNAATKPAPARLVYRPDGWDSTVFDVVGDDARQVQALALQQVVTSHDGGATWATTFTAPDGEFLNTLQRVGATTYVTSYQHIWAAPDGAGFTSMHAPADFGYYRVAGWPHGPGGLVVAADGEGVYTSADGGQTYRRVGLTATTVQALGIAQNADGQQVLTVGTNHASFATPVPTGAVNLGTRDWGVNGEETSIGGRVFAQAVSPADPHVVYRAATGGFGSRWVLSRSSDGGTTWQSVLMPRISGRATAIAVDPADPHRVYVGYADALGAGVLISRDDGQTWTAENVEHLFTAIVADPHNPDRIWLGGPDGLFRSDDAGRSVTRLQTVPVGALAMDPADPNHFVIGGTALYDSPDGGVTLRPAAATDLRLGVTAFAFAQGGAVYAAAGAGGDPSGLPAGGRGVLRSDDGGRTWQNVSAGLANRDVSSLAVTPDGRWLFAGTVGGGVYRLATG